MQLYGGAALAGHEALVDELLKKPGANINAAVEGAALAGHEALLAKLKIKVVPSALEYDGLKKQLRNLSSTGEEQKNTIQKQGDRIDELEKKLTEQGKLLAEQGRLLAMLIDAEDTQKLEKPVPTDESGFFNEGHGAVGVGAAGAAAAGAAATPAP